MIVTVTIQSNTAKPIPEDKALAHVKKTAQGMLCVASRRTLRSNTRKNSLYLVNGCLLTYEEYIEYLEMKNM